MRNLIDLVVARSGTLRRGPLRRLGQEHHAEEHSAQQRGQECPRNGTAFLDGWGGARAHGRLNFRIWFWH